MFLSLLDYYFCKMFKKPKVRNTSSLFRACQFPLCKRNGVSLSLSLLFKQALNRRCESPGFVIGVFPLSVTQPGKVKEEISRRAKGCFGCPLEINNTIIINPNTQNTKPAVCPSIIHGRLQEVEGRSLQSAPRISTLLNGIRLLTCNILRTY